MYVVYTHNPLTVTVKFEEVLNSQLMDVLAILRRLPKITALDLSNYEDDFLVELLQELSWGSIPAALGCSSWLCPDLRELSIEGCSDESVLLDMVAKRTHAAVLNETGAEVNGVARLRKLCVFVGSAGMVGVKTERQIQRVLGSEGQCIWLTEHGDELEDIEAEEDEHGGDDGSVVSADMGENSDDGEGNQLGLSPPQTIYLRILFLQLLQPNDGCHVRGTR